MSSDHGNMHALTADQRQALDGCESGTVRMFATCAMHVYPAVAPAAVVAAVREWLAPRTERTLANVRYPLAYVEGSRRTLDALVARHAREAWRALA